MSEDWEGQLCPYDDCAWKCEFNDVGWYRCPHCRRLFFVRVSDSDYEDWFAYREFETDESKPDILPVAGDRGPSWGTPREQA